MSRLGHSGTHASFTGVEETGRRRRIRGEEQLTGSVRNPETGLGR